MLSDVNQPAKFLETPLLMPALLLMASEWPNTVTLCEESYFPRGRLRDSGEVGVDGWGNSEGGRMAGIGKASCSNRPVFRGCLSHKGQVIKSFLLFKKTRAGP